MCQPSSRGPVPGVLEALARQVAARPDATAVEGVGGALTYAQLDRMRSRVASAMPGGVIGVLTSRNTALPAALLGVLGSGARWLLLDPVHPRARLARVAAAADVRALLICPGAALPPVARGAPGPDAFGSLPDVGVDFSDDVEPRTATADSVQPPDPRGYLMATSGTTGVPALVTTTERPLAAFLDWYTERFGIGADDATAVLSGLTHDALLRDLFAPLVVGGRVYVPAQELLRDPDALLDELGAARVTIAHLTPQLARVLARSRQRVPGLRLIVLAGDTLTGADVRALRRLAPNAEIVNGYGTTETPQLHAYAVVTDAVGDGPLPVGTGVAGGHVLVVDGEGAPAEVGVLGEVLVRGHHLADGYLPGAARVDADGRSPFGSGVYRTGDLGRYGPDGAVTLVGRRDHQVSVRGHRIEPGEIEAVLRARPDVVDAVVVARTDVSGETTLAAYAASDTATPDGLRAVLVRELPEPAVPATLTVLPRLPLTPGGKVDRAALPSPRRTGTVSPGGSATERLVAALWCEVLGLPRVGPDESFFALGGHSLALVAVHARLVPLLDRDVPLVDLFHHPTPRALARHLDGVARTGGPGRAERRVAARRNAPRRAARGTAHDHPAQEPR